MSKSVKKRQTEERYCGSKLADKLMEVCNGTYEGPNNTDQGVNNTDLGVNNTDKGVNNTDLGVNTDQGVNTPRKRDLRTVLWFQSQAEKEVRNTKFPFYPRSAANKFKKRSFRRQKREGGVADECCINKGCTVTELRQYCAER